MEVAAVSLLLIAWVGAFLALISALVLLRPKTERLVACPQAMKQFVILASILSLVCIVLYKSAAKATFFGALVASGSHTAAITMRLLVDGGAPIAGGVIGRNIELKWPRPTRAGDALSVESEIIEVLPSPSHPNRGVIVVRTETRNQRGGSFKS